MKVEINVSRSPEGRLQIHSLVKQQYSNYTFMQSSGVSFVTNFKTSL